MAQFDIRNWYWFIGSDQTRVYSSALGDYVSVSDPNFVAWIADGTRPTTIDSEASLGDVLSPHLLRPAAAGVLAGYQDSQAGGVVILTAFKVLFNHENRLRALEGKAPLTAAQARAAVKALM